MRPRCIFSTVALLTMLTVLASVSTADDGPALPTGKTSEAELDLGVCLLAEETILESPFTPVATLLAACCFPDGTCENLPRADCFDDGGWPHRIGTYCSAIECHYPDEIPCCLPDGTCQELQPRICNREGGTPHYAQGSCSDVECAPAP